MIPPVWLVTGAGSGVGRALAVFLNASGAEVILAGRSSQALADTAQWCGPRTQTAFLDLADLGSVNSLVTRVDALLDGRPLGGIVHAAGIMAWDSPATPSGWSRVPLVNAVSPWRLTQGLEPVLLKPPGGRVLFVAGAGFTLQGVVPSCDGWFGNQPGRGIRLSLEAASAKVLMARVLHRRWVGRASAFAFHPGFVKSHLADSLPFPLNTLGCLAQPFLSTRSRTGEFLVLDPGARDLSGFLVQGRRGVLDCPLAPDLSRENALVSLLSADQSAEERTRGIGWTPS